MGEGRCSRLGGARISGGHWFYLRFHDRSDDRDVVLLCQSKEIVNCVQDGMDHILFTHHVHEQSVQIL